MKKALLLLLLPLVLSGCWETSRGQKIGMVVKVYEQGLFFKTKEAELIRISGRGNVATGITPFDCSVENKEVYKQLQDLLDKEVEIKVEYHTEMAVSPARGSTYCMIDEVLGQVNTKE